MKYLRFILVVVSFMMIAACVVPEPGDGDDIVNIRFKNESDESVMVISDWREDISVDNIVKHRYEPIPVYPDETVIINYGVAMPKLYVAVIKLSVWERFESGDDMVLDELIEQKYEYTYEELKSIRLKIKYIGKAESMK